MTSLRLIPGASIAPGLPPIEERRARVRARSLMILTPIARDPVWQYTRALTSTAMALAEAGVRFGFQFVVGSSNVARSRNELMAHFLASDFTDAMFVDDDMDFSPGDVMRLLASEQPVIGGVGRMRCEKPNSDPSVWCCRWLPDGSTPQDGMGAIEVLGFGSAFMLINRAAVEMIIEAHPEWRREAPRDWPEPVRAQFYEFLRFGHEDGEKAYVGEDYVFCDRWRALGGKVFIDPDITLGHVGSFNFRGSVNEQLVEAA